MIPLKGRDAEGGLIALGLDIPLQLRCNDVIGNVVVMAAAFSVFGIGAAWSEIAAAVILIGFSASDGWQILHRAELEWVEECRHCRLGSGFR